jgi:cysteinyl-tRNA synthetase
MSDLLKVHSPDTLRTLLLSSHYRRPIDFGPERLEEVERGLQTFHRAFERFAELTGERFDQLDAPTHRDEFDSGGSALLQEIAEHRQQFLDAMDDDFNTGGAIGELFEVVHALNRFTNQLTPDLVLETPGRRAEYRAGMVVLKELCQILGLFDKPIAVGQPAGDALTAPLLGLLIDLRARLRKEKNFGLADEIRNRLTALGVTLEDRPDGTRWRIEPRR